MMPPPHSTPSFPLCRSALSALLTAPLASRLGESDPRPLLALLSSGTEEERPTAIWSPEMRELALNELRGSAGGEVSGREVW